MHVTEKKGGNTKKERRPDLASEMVKTVLERPEFRALTMGPPRCTGRETEATKGSRHDVVRGGGEKIEEKESHNPVIHGPVCAQLVALAGENDE